ncbi:hypothetical protein QZQ56_09830 [Serratia marcescens]|uniref:hypothetical protein n=1 Tax=Serratia TaxID=613 RepID=UPI001A1FB0D2|nr:hypothetical protein [Serratia marcescens]MBI6147223.1 hypothetical protein [Serratia marcescens]MDP8838676.1 hypothetical protein [Serratia marcescens]HEJ6935126.1 hypothetical protein [Serratia marcescens]HEJ7843188.1 hypothetical protein [Serratia marcescens]
MRHEQEQRALVYFDLDDGQEAENHWPSTASADINTIKRPLSKLERQIDSFAESIGFSLDACILKSVARGQRSLSRVSATGRGQTAVYISNQRQ